MLLLREQLSHMSDPRRVAMMAIYGEFSDLFHAAPGSSHNHQAWSGGYADHLAETMGVNEVTYKALQTIRPLPFTQDSATICLYLHDIEKPFKYGPVDDPRVAPWYEQNARLLRAARLNDLMDGDAASNFNTWEDVKYLILDHLMKRFDFTLTPDEKNALKYTHGEGNRHRKDARVSCPLAAHVHHCDNTSARIWFDGGQGEG